MEQIEDSPINATQIEQWTDQEPVMSRVRNFVQSGWPAKSPDQLITPYFKILSELSIQDGCIPQGSRVIIPLKGQPTMLQSLHEGHPAMQTIKDGIRKQFEGTVEQKLARFLLTFRVTPQTTTGVAPCELLMGRRIRTKLDRVRPDLKLKVTERQSKQKDVSQQVVERSNIYTATWDKVYVKNFAKGPKWLPGKIEAKTGPVSYTVTINEGHTIKRYIDHVRKTNRLRRVEHKHSRDSRSGS
ncbi:uncharacterized protein [Argopecten irradians]|uniref:uncharacterized protein n=1 Tax=Argopecten irradians TaxID=31199 RepID=UPI003716ABE3